MVTATLQVTNTITVAQSQVNVMEMPMIVLLSQSLPTFYHTAPTLLQNIVNPYLLHSSSPQEFLQKHLQTWGGTWGHWENRFVVPNFKQNWRISDFGYKLL